MIIAGQNFRTNREVSLPQQINIVTNTNVYNNTSIESVNANTTKNYPIGSFHSLSVLVKGVNATITIGSASPVALYEGQNLDISYNETNNVSITLITGLSTTLLCTVKTL